MLLALQGVGGRPISRKKTLHTAWMASVHLHAKHMDNVMYMYKKKHYITSVLGHDRLVIAVMWQKNSRSSFCSYCG